METQKIPSNARSAVVRQAYTRGSRGQAAKARLSRPQKRPGPDWSPGRGIEQLEEVRGFRAGAWRVFPHRNKPVDFTILYPVSHRTKYGRWEALGERIPDLVAMYVLESVHKRMRNPEPFNPGSIAMPRKTRKYGEWSEFAGRPWQAVPTEGCPGLFTVLYPTDCLTQYGYWDVLGERIPERVAAFILDSVHRRMREPEPLNIHPDVSIRTALGCTGAEVWGSRDPWWHPWANAESVIVASSMTEEELDYRMRKLRRLEGHAR